MSNFDNAIKTFDDTVKGWLSFIDNNEYVTAALTIFLIVYASYAAPKLPPYILNLFDYTVFKLLFFFLIVYISKRNPTVAIVASVALMVTIMALNKLKLDRLMMGLLYKEKEHMSIKYDGLPRPENELTMEDIINPEASLYPEQIVGIEDEVKGQPLEQGCTKRANYRNSFYPQYVNMKPDAYLSRYTGNEVNGFDSNAAYASI